MGSVCMERVYLMSHQPAHDVRVSLHKEGHVVTGTCQHFFVRVKYQKTRLKARTLPKSRDKAYYLPVVTIDLEHRDPTRPIPREKRF